MAQRNVCFELVLLACCLASLSCALASKFTEKSVEIRQTDPSSWFGALGTEEDNVVTTPVAEKMESVHVNVDNETLAYEDDEYFSEEIMDEENITSDAQFLKEDESEYSEAVSLSPAIANTSSIWNSSKSSPSGSLSKKNSSTYAEIGSSVQNSSKSSLNGSETRAKATTKPANSSSVRPEGRSLPGKSKGDGSSSGKTEEVNYWQTDGSSDQMASGSSKTSNSEESKDEQQVSVKEHDRNPHPLAFSSSGDNEWFGFGEGEGGGGGSSSSGFHPSKNRNSGTLGGSASVAVEDYQTKEQGNTKDAELETAVEIKEHDELAPGTHGGGSSSSSSDDSWFSDFGSHDSAVSKTHAKPSSSGGGGGGGGSSGDDVWFGLESSEWQPVASSSHRQQRKLNWGEDDPRPETAAADAKDYDDVDIITAPPDSGKSRDVFSFVVESSFGGNRHSKASGKKDTDGVDNVEIITAKPGKETEPGLGWLAAQQEDQLREEKPPERTKTIVVKSQTSTTTVRSTVIGRSRSSVSPLPPSVISSPSINRSHSFINLLAKKSSATFPRPQEATKTPAAADTAQQPDTPKNSSQSQPLEENDANRFFKADQQNQRAAPVSTTSTAKPPSTSTAKPPSTSTAKPPSTTSTAKPPSTITNAAVPSTVAPEPTTTTNGDSITPGIGKSDPRYEHDSVLPTAEGVSVVGLGTKQPFQNEQKAAVTPVTVSNSTTVATELPTRSGRTFADMGHTNEAETPTKIDKTKNKSSDISNFTAAAAAAAASETRTVLGNNALQGASGPNRNDELLSRNGSPPATENLSYILVGTCCGVSLICLVIVVTVLRYRKSQQRHRRSLHEPFHHSPMYSPTSYSYPPASRLSHSSPNTWSDRAYSTYRKDCAKDARIAKGVPAPPPLPDSKARMWFMGRKQSPYSLCDQHLSYCSNQGYAHDAADYTKPGLETGSGVVKEDAGRRERRCNSEGALAKGPAPVYRTGFSGLSDARHSSGLDYMNKGEMIYWSSNNEQLI